MSTLFTPTPTTSTAPAATSTDLGNTLGGGNSNLGAATYVIIAGSVSGGASVGGSEQEQGGVIGRLGILSSRMGDERAARAGYDSVRTVWTSESGNEGETGTRVGWMRSSWWERHIGIVRTRAGAPT